MAQIVTGNNTTGVVNVDGNYDLMTSSPQVNSRFGGASGTPNYVGAARQFYERDSGALTGTPLLLAPLVSTDHRLHVGLDTSLFTHEFNAAAQDTGNWNYNFTTMTMTESAGSLLINANSSNGSAVGCYLQSRRYFSLQVNSGLRYQTTLATVNAVLAGEVFLFGFGLPASAVAAPTDGIWFQLTSAGLIGVTIYNGATTQTGTLPTGGGSAFVPVSGQNYQYKIIINDRLVEFWVNDQVLSTLPCPSGLGLLYSTISLPVFYQYYNTGAVTGTSMQVKVAALNIDMLDTASNKPWNHIQASKGLARQGMSGGTMGALTFFTNNTNPTTALPVNTSLTANLPNLPQGGIGLATLWNLASTDMVMHQVQNPVGGVSQPPRTMYIVGVRISAAAFTATWTAPAAGAHILLWQVAHGGTATSIATAESASFTGAGSTKLHRRTMVGMMTWATGAAPVGTPPDRGDIYYQFQTPIVVNPGEYLSTLCRMVNGAATATGGLYYTVDYDHYFE